MAKAQKIKSVSYDKYGYLFILPFFIIFFVFQLYTMVYTINLSFTDLAGFKTDYTYTGLDNYVFLLHNNIFWKSIGNTFFIWIMNFTPQLLFALLFASIFTSIRFKMKGVGFFKVVFYMPNIITAASVAVLFNALVNHPYGPIDMFLTQIGVIESDFQLLRDPLITQMLVAFILFLMWFGSTMILLIAGILGINTELYEAAMVDGANSINMFYKITLPSLKPIMLYVLVTSAVGGLQMFDIPYLFHNGGPNFATETMAVFIFRQAFTAQGNYNIAAAGSVYLLIIAVVISVLLFKGLSEKKEKNHDKK